MSHVDISRYSKRFVQLFWDPSPKNDDATTIWCLGRIYECQPPPQENHQRPIDSSSSSALSPSAPPSSEESWTEAQSSVGSFEEISADRGSSTVVLDNEEWPKAFLDDFESRIWLTYRSNFPPIPKSQDPKVASTMSFSVRLKSQLTNQGGFMSDTGWGCMIRSGQSLLANALSVLRLGRDWTRGARTADEQQLLSLFADDPRAPFSIHRFVEHGAAACGTYPGQWFGPSATAKCIEALSNNFEAAGLKVYVTGDGPDVFEDTLFQIARSGTQQFCPTLLLVGTRLGIDRVTPAYWDALKAVLQMPQSVGIAGGRPSSSHYFVGTQGATFFYLDPHQTRPALRFHETPEEYTAEEIDSCHTRRLRRLPIEEMDPSMLIGFLLRNEAEWRSWRHAVTEAPGKAIFHVADSRPARYGHSTEREAAVDEVETFDEDEEHEVGDGAT